MSQQSCCVPNCTVTLGNEQLKELPTSFRKDNKSPLSFDTSENNRDEEELQSLSLRNYYNEAHNILPRLRDSEGEQSTLEQTNNVPGNYEDQLTSKLHDNLSKFDLSGHYVSRQNDNLPTYDLPGGCEAHRPSTSRQHNNLPGRGISIY
ncbi:unnamed protein product [Parnassius apollo]|uniref:(apollo) hypothetical protein n=1 Tax=Parnassius apollo TaxID=110799 RepID=A0A8S3XP42_PARAO|nr:unnamed protein product [Parnassius apollo]